MAFKRVSLCVAISAMNLLISSPASATGIPVYCFNCQEGSSNAAHAILDGIRSQTEALLNAMDYSMRAQEKLATAREVAMGSTAEKIKNSYAMEPSLGAKPRAACGQYGAAGLRATAQSSGPQLRQALTKRTQAHNNQGRNLAKGEPRKDYSINQIISVLDDPKEPVFSGEMIMSNKPVSGEDFSALEKLRQKQELVVNPYPVEMPTEDDVKRIKANGSAEEKTNLAQTIALQKRQEIGQYVLDEAFERNIQRLDPTAIKYMIQDLDSYLSEDQKRALNGKISPNQLDELMATYRVRSEEWVKSATTSPSEAMARREMMLSNAEILNQVWESKQVLNQILRVLAFSDVRNVSKDGMLSK
ncbi:hypothetical protein [Pseudomonas syringae]|uniref:hypothetical protein n=1 Tax=Pseudomonas syringae TaxID=317 RepID=UPI00245F501B|nr:hypothetical protein [Pseudomonas syringae]MDH4602450.1 hypothetical protein [Pseudomonas syringae pv. papulans]